MNEEYLLDLSFIIPVFNGHSTIIQCLSSIFALDLPIDRFEIIVIDDFSTDNTLNLLRDLANKHSNLIVLHQESNSKPGGARNRGIRLARGKYIMFVDADDAVCLSTASVLRKALALNLDMYHFHAKIDGLRYNAPIPEDELMTGESFANQYYSLASDTGYLWAYLYSNSFLRRVNYPFVEKRVHEDADWCEKHIWSAKRIAHSNECVYIHKTNMSSIMHTLSPYSDADNIMMCYRRMVFADTIKKAPSNFRSVIIDHSKTWINAVLSLHHMTRHSLKGVSVLFLSISDEAYTYLSQFDWRGFSQICLKHRKIAVFVLHVLYPISAFYRLIS